MKKTGPFLDVNFLINCYTEKKNDDLKVFFHNAKTWKIMCDFPQTTQWVYTGKFKSKLINNCYFNVIHDSLGDTYVYKFDEVDIFVKYVNEIASDSSFGLLANDIQNGKQSFYYLKNDCVVKLSEQLNNDSFDILICSKKTYDLQKDQLHKGNYGV